LQHKDNPVDWWQWGGGLVRDFLVLAELVEVDGRCRAGRGDGTGAAAADADPSAWCRP
jgi:hypothetical protein